MDKISNKLSVQVSAPIEPGTILVFEDEDGVTLKEAMLRAFWQERPLGGKEFCYETVSGRIVPLSKMKFTEAQEKFELIEFDEIDLLKGQVAQTRKLSEASKLIILNVLDDTAQGLGIAKLLIEQKLITLQSILADED